MGLRKTRNELSFLLDVEQQVTEVKRAAEQVAQLRRVGKGLGVYEFDRQLA